MNNNNYIGSSLFVVNLDFYYRSGGKITEDEVALQSLKASSNTLGPDCKMKMERLKKAISKHQLSIVPNINLPPIK
jgi:hypothetical protein